MDGCKVYAITQPAWTALSSCVQCRCAIFPLRFPKTLRQCWAPKIETRNSSVCICLWCLDLLWESSGNGFPLGESLFGRDQTWSSALVRASTEWDKVYSLMKHVSFSSLNSSLLISISWGRPGKKGGIKEFGSVKYFLFLVGKVAEIPAFKSILKIT